MLSFTEENYLKALLKITIDNNVVEVGTNELASHLDVKPATVTDMLKKLKEKQLINYEKYGKISLNDNGRKIALEILRKHRLWETFLYQKLDFNWDEVHEIAEQLEHIKSAKLINKLDAFLDFPQFDPHGDPIPTEQGEIKVTYKKTLSEVSVGDVCKLVAVKDNSAAFLQYVVKIGLGISSIIKVIGRQDFDAMMMIDVDGTTHHVSEKFAENVFVL
ncbi:metal-dependent transcriptional regulator [Pedobacter arcticus]|uniref:metal-dependent transcriptional regulator n=1 Tax=Pedobacter arcticus TaxID=752140 RepID=UPI000318E64E|nr:metal-dependent transcriptional regulator [Pedobacter arcticus]